MNLYTAPEKITTKLDKIIFLAGSIEQDKAEMWQDKVIQELQDFNVTVLNPRRDAWDDSWVQSIDNKPFKEQVTWELDSLESADIIFIYFDPNTQSPISLLELGLYANSGKCLVCCPEGFWRKGNVDIICERYGVELITDLNSAIDNLCTFLTE